MPNEPHAEQDLKEISFPEAPRVPFLRMQSMNRVLGYICFTLIAIILALVIAIISLFPLKTKELVLVQLDPATNNRYLLAKADEALQSIPNLISTILRTYVVDREKINQVDEALRYVRVQAMSNEYVFKAFTDIYSNKESSPLYQEGLKRDIQITNDRSLAEGIHQVEFTRIDTQEKTHAQVTTKWVAQMTYGFADRKGSIEDKLLNPLGIFVVQYSLTKRQE